MLGLGCIPDPHDAARKRAELFRGLSGSTRCRVRHVPQGSQLLPMQRHRRHVRNHGVPQRVGRRVS